MIKASVAAPITRKSNLENRHDNVKENVHKVYKRS